MKFNRVSSLALLSVAIVTLAGCSNKVSKQDTLDDLSDTSSQPSASVPDDPSTAPTAESSSALTIGSVAPSVNVEHWVSNGHGKFSEVNDFEEGKIYVVEFWATWCGPCINSMPHLVEIQEQYGDQGVQLVSVSDEDLETVKQFLQRPFLDGEEGGPETYGELTSAYCLTTDPDRSVYLSYMEAANQNGIPTAFIVGRTGLVEWIGHPMGMDQPLAAIVEDRWDRVGFKSYFEESQKMATLRSDIMRLASQGNLAGATDLLRKAKSQFDDSPMLMELERALTLAPIQRLVSQGDIDGAIDQMQTAIASLETEFMPPIEFDLLALLLEAKRDEQSIATLAEIKDKLSPRMANMICWKIYQRGSTDNDVPDDLLSTALSVAEKAADDAPGDGSILDTLAHLLHVQGDLDRAIEVQTKAVENPGQSAEELQSFLQQLRDERDSK